MTVPREEAPLLLYGANGYTARLITAELLALGIRPVLAGRNAAAVQEEAARHGLRWRVASLDDTAATDRMLEGIQVVLHCAGPFIRTWRAMSEACLRARAHYLDITGEIGVFEGLAARDEEARAAGIMLLPGAGFDVVPSDCLAAHVAARLPGATHLELHVVGLGRVSRGTTLTVLESLDGRARAAVRRNGRIVQVRPDFQSRATMGVDSSGGWSRPLVTTSWGDVSTAWYSTRIPNIEVYMALPRSAQRLLRWGGLLMPLVASTPVKRFLQRRVAAGIDGPTAEERARSGAHLSARVWNEVRWAMSFLETPDAYTLTSRTAASIAARVLRGEFTPGFQTPSLAYGADFILGFSGVKRTDARP